MRSSGNLGIGTKKREHFGSLARLDKSTFSRVVNGTQHTIVSTHVTRHCGNGVLVKNNPVIVQTVILDVLLAAWNPVDRLQEIPLSNFAFKRIRVIVQALDGF